MSFTAGGLHGTSISTSYAYTYESTFDLSAAGISITTEQLAGYGTSMYGTSTSTATIDGSSIEIVGPAAGSYDNDGYHDGLLIKNTSNGDIQTAVRRDGTIFAKSGIKTDGDLFAEDGTVYTKKVFLTSDTLVRNDGNPGRSVVSSTGAIPLKVALVVDSLSVAQSMLSNSGDNWTFGGSDTGVSTTSHPSLTTATLSTGGTEVVFNGTNGALNISTGIVLSSGLGRRGDTIYIEI